MDLKEQAGRKAAEYVKDGMVVGLGTGSTAAWAIRAIADRVKAGEIKDIQCIPTSSATRQLADELGLSIRGLEDVEWVDLTVDGADQVDENLNLIKGAGGALLREKVVAFSSGEVIIVIDETKLTDQLGTGCAVPVEVIPFAEAVVRQALINLGANVTVRDKAGRTPLHVAAGYGRKSIAEILIAHGTNIHAQTQDGETALHEAAGNGYLYLCQLLVRQGADLIYSIERNSLLGGSR